jgi:sugar lactone lactonase YvrE
MNRRFLSQLAGIVLAIGLAGVWLGSVAARPIQFAEFTSGQDAALVLGQPDFTTVTQAGSYSDNAFNYPRVVAVDRDTGKVFVADTNNNRVLRFASFDDLNNGASAEMVFGQPDFTTYSSNKTKNGVNSPRGLAVHNGKLYVSDTNNNRVLRYNNASTVNYSGTAPDAVQVIGQPDYTNTTYTTDAQTLSAPYGLKIDFDGNLYVTDYSDHRVLRFDNIETRGDYPMPDAVFGQPDFVTTNYGGGAANLSNPHDIAIGDDGTLYIADDANDRIMVYANGQSVSGGGHTASGVLGQSTLDNPVKDAAPSDTTINGPKGVLLDSENNLWIAEANNNRVVRFVDVSATTIGGRADLVLGKPDFTSADTTASASVLTDVFGIAADQEGTLYVADQEGHRVVAFRGVVPVTPTPTTETPAFCAQPPTLAIKPDPLEIAPGGAATVWVELVNSCRDLPSAPVDVLLSLSDGLTVIETSEGVLNLGQRAALQRFSLDAGAMLGWYAVVRASDPFVTAPLAVAEVYAGAAVVRNANVTFSVPTAPAPAPAAPAEPAPAPAPAAPAPLPSALPNTAGAALPLGLLAVSAAGAAAVILGRRIGRR